MSAIRERYSRAATSSDLRVHNHRAGDVDVMIASGLAPDGIASALYRLQIEFDSVRMAIRGAEALSQIERFLILDKLKTLPEARRRLGVFAMEQAGKYRFWHSPDVVMAVAGKVLDVYLDPTCHHCEGRGFNGATHRGEREIPCRPCRASGNRRDQAGEDQEGRKFAAAMLAELETCAAEFDRQLKRFLAET